MTYRLLKVVCQPVLVSEDAEGNLIEHVAQPLTVSSAEIAAFPARLVAQIEKLNQESNGQVSSLASALSP